VLKRWEAASVVVVINTSTESSSPWVAHQEDQGTIHTVYSPLDLLIVNPLVLSYRSTIRLTRQLIVYVVCVDPRLRVNAWDDVSDHTNVLALNYPGARGPQPAAVVSGVLLL
jgi:hypothetical protein